MCLNLFFKRRWIPYYEERRILRLDQSILPIHMYNLQSTLGMVGKGFPFTHSLFGTCWLMIVEMMAYFSGILVLEWLPNHTFFFFWKRPSINTGRKNENKENTSAYPVAYKLTKQECQRKAKLTSFSQRQGAQVPSLSTQKNAVNMASIFHPIAIPAS